MDEEEIENLIEEKTRPFISWWELIGMIVVAAILIKIFG
jgi:hypothetical protein